MLSPFPCHGLAGKGISGSSKASFEQKRSLALKGGKSKSGYFSLACSALKAALYVLLPAELSAQVTFPLRVTPLKRLRSLVISGSVSSNQHIT